MKEGTFQLIDSKVIQTEIYKFKFKGVEYLIKIWVEKGKWVDYEILEPEDSDEDIDNIMDALDAAMDKNDLNL